MAGRISKVDVGVGVAILELDRRDLLGEDTTPCEVQ